MDTVFFVVAKLTGAVLRVEAWLLLMALFAVWADFRGRGRMQRVASVVLALVLLAVGVLPFGDVMLRPIEEEVPRGTDPEDIDGIIVLGGGEDIPASRYWTQPELGPGGDRYLAALELAHAHPEARVLFTGGSGRLREAGNLPEVGEAEIARQVFEAHGLADERLLFEGRSRNTAENARLGHALVVPSKDERWVLITSAFHMPRALRSFTQAGWTGIIPYPVDYRTRAWADGLGWNFGRNLELMNLALREWVGRAAYAATGQ